MAINNYDPNTGKKLKTGQTITFNGQTVTQGTTFGAKGSYGDTSSSSNTLPARNYLAEDGGAGYDIVEKKTNAGMVNPDSLSASDYKTYLKTSNTSPVAGSTINSTGGGNTLSSVINTNTLAGNNQKMDLTGTNPNDFVTDSSAFAITAPQEESALQKQQKESDSILQKMMDSIQDVPDTASIDRKLRNQLQIEQKQQAVNDLTGQLNAIVNKGQAQQLAQVGQGRGIPEAIIGGIQAQIGRETAIAALPVQAQLQAAQGNLEMANDSLDRLFKIYSDDATNRYNAKNKMFEVAYGIADKKEQRLLDEQSKLNDRAYAETQQDYQNAQKYASIALANNQSTLASKIMKLDYKSPTFKNELAKLISQVYDPTVELDRRLKEAQLTSVKDETATQAKERQDKEKVAAQKIAQIPIIKEKIDLVNKLKDHSGLNTRVGPTALGLPTRTTFGIADSFGEGQDFAASVQQLTNQDTLATLLELKASGGTLGAVSEKELDLLQKAASKINAWEVKDKNGMGKGQWNVSEKKFKEELDTVLKSSEALYQSLGGSSGETQNLDNFLNIVDGAIQSSEGIYQSSGYNL